MEAQVVYSDKLPEGLSFEVDGILVIGIKPGVEATSAEQKVG